jgi:PPK2 family polyphosphate:nucleotide phosphotransferase
MASSPIDALRVAPGSKNPLRGRATDESFGWDKESAKIELDAIKLDIEDLQRRLYAEGTRSVLVVLQGMDASGKDGAVRSVMSGVNPAGVQVTSFKAPTGQELRHDYLWRCHAATPPSGEIAVWNRSHYEDVLIVRVKSLVPKARWHKRYGHIRDFERMLADEGTSVVKLYLHISKDEQRERLQNRVDTPSDRWKFNPADLVERDRWPAYMSAFSDALRETSTDAAPWYVIPADRKWVRNLAVAKVLQHTLRGLKPRYPDAAEGVIGTVVK